MRPHLPVLAAALLLSPAAWAQGFKCPAAGTVVETRTGTNTSTNTFKGADSANPLVCIVQTASGERRWLANLYGPGTSDDVIAPKMAELLSGKIAETSFTVTLRVQGGGNSTFFEQWSASGRERIEVAGKPIEAMVFRRRINGVGGSHGFSADYRHWFDPATGLWLKREVTVYNGNPVPPQQVTAIKLP